MSIVAWLVVGLIAGVIANYIMSGGYGLIGSCVLGIIGALVGGFIATTLFRSTDVTGINIYSIAISVVGAVIVIGLARALRRA